MNKNLCSLHYLFALSVCLGYVTDVAAQEKESKKHHEIRYKMTITTTPPTQEKCEARIDVTYFQKNTVAVVNSTISNQECGTSSGDYTVLVRFRDENNEMQSLEYPETWQRDDYREIESRKEYFIGDNVDLIAVRSRKLRCICDGTDEEQGAPEK